METDAAVGAAGIPSVYRFLGLTQMVQLIKLHGCSSRTTVRLPILQGVRGVLRPVRMLQGFVCCQKLCYDGAAALGF